MRLLFTLLMTVLCRTLSAQNGSNSYEYLNVPVSAHSAALGGQNTSVIEDDVSLIYNNPAALSNVTHNTLSLDYTSYIASTMKLGAAYARQAGQYSTWAVAAQYLSYGSMEETDHFGNSLGQFTPSDLNIQGTYAYLMSQYWCGAVTAKMLYSKYAEYSAFAIGVDLGLNYYNPEAGLSLSFTGRNFGGQIDPLYEQRETLPFNFSMGISKDLGHAPVRLSLTFDDLTHWKGINFIQHCIIGADIFLGKAVWVGLGYNFRRAHEMKIADRSSKAAGLSVGGGLNIKKFRIGVAWGKYHIAANSLTVNASFAF